MTQLVLASRWTQPAARRGQVLQAIQDQDGAALCELVTYHVRLRGVAGSDTSPQTLRNYHLAIRDFLAWAWSESQTLALNQLTAEQVEQYLLHLRTRPHRPRTRHARPTTGRLSADSARSGSIKRKPDSSASLRSSRAASGMRACAACSAPSTS